MNTHGGHENPCRKRRPRRTENVCPFAPAVRFCCEIQKYSRIYVVFRFLHGMGISAHAAHSRTAPAVPLQWASQPTRCHSPPADAASPGTAAPGTRQIRAFQPITAAAGISAHAAHSRTAPAVSTQWASQPKKSPAQRIYGHLPPVFRFPGSCPCKKILQIFLCPFTDSQKSCIMMLYIMTSEVLPYGT